MGAKLTVLLTALFAVPTVAYCDGPTEKPKVDTKYITKDFVAAIVAHPKRALDGAVLKALLAAVKKSGGKAVAEEPFRETIKNLGLDLRNMQQVVILMDKNTIQSSGLLFLFRPRLDHRHDHGPGFEEKIEKSVPDEKSAPDVEDRKTDRAGDGGDEADGPAAGQKDADPAPDDVVAVLDDGEEPDVAPARAEPIDPDDIGDGFGRRPRRHYGPAMIFRLAKPMDRKAVMKAWSIDTYEIKVERFANGRIKSRRSVHKKAPPKKTVYKDFVYYVNHRTAFYIPDDRTLVSAPEPVLKKMLDAKSVQSPLIARLQALGTQPDGAIVLDVKALAPMFATMPKRFLPRDVVKLLGYLPKIKTLTATADVTTKPSASIVLEATDAKTAAELGTLIDKRLLPLGKAFYELKRPEMDRYGRDPTAKTTRAILDGIIDGAAASRAGTQVTVTTAGPKNLVALVKQFGRVAGAQVKQVKRKNNLKQIGLAFHNYHDVYGRFPAHGANAAGKAGLSWRVHLLPQLEEAELYRQFKLDEAWDSPHNKKLIAKMPKLFRTPGVTATGKTAIHVFVGPNAPFGGKAGPRIRDIVDGTSNTFLAVEAGPDKADVWTKPGGLRFDVKEDPRDVLGKIDHKAGFLALMMDGSVHVITKETSAETMRRMIQHNDG
ncbi:MAG: DUF1559 domain-containing protein, partial [Planctomycetaceae bacterium]